MDESASKFLQLATNSRLASALLSSRPTMSLVPCPRNNMAFVAIKMGRRQGARSGAYLNRYVTDEQRGRRPILNATLWAVASWLFFRVARSARINSDMGASLLPVRLGPP